MDYEKKFFKTKKIETFIKTNKTNLGRQHEQIIDPEKNENTANVFKLILDKS
tara:strand:+ start:306 stop:461 length:156 start_codon:yes stop_codon:yes gene_type:complete